LFFSGCSSFLSREEKKQKKALLFFHEKEKEQKKAELTGAWLVFLSMLPQFKFLFVLFFSKEKDTRRKGAKERGVGGCMAGFSPHVTPV